jgi:predicted nucleic acid-binding Zn ribbon protein
MLEDITQEFCSDRCRVEHEEKERQRKRQSYFVGFSFLAYIVIVIAFVVLRPIFF